MIEKDLASASAEYQTLMKTDLPAFNRALSEKGVTPLWRLFLRWPACSEYG